MTAPKLDAAIFDLDGTLWDATAACAIGWTRAARKHGLDREITPAQIGSVCGLTFDACVEPIFGDLEPAALHALRPDIAAFEEAAVREHGGVLYPGVADGLRELARRTPIFLLSNCHRWYLELFLATPGVGGLFRDDLCHGDTNLPKGENLVLLTRKHALRSAVYVGDTEGDRAAAAEAGCAFVFAAYGFGEVATARPFHDFGSLCRHLAERTG